MGRKGGIGGAVTGAAGKRKKKEADMGGGIGRWLQAFQNRERPQTLPPGPVSRPMRRDISGPPVVSRRGKWGGGRPAAGGGGGALRSLFGQGR